MKTPFKTIIIGTLIVTGLLFSCKKQDGYSDEVITTDTTAAATDSLSKNNMPASSSATGGATNQDVPKTGAQSTSAGTTNTGTANVGTTEPKNNETKGTGTGTGPGPSAKDGSAYSGPSDPQNDKIETKKNKTAKNVKD